MSKGALRPFELVVDYTCQDSRKWGLGAAEISWSGTDSEAQSVLGMVCHHEIGKFFSDQPGSASERYSISLAGLP